jgi:hypothetical protein
MACSPKMNNLHEARMQRFNSAHSSTRLVENSIGILKEKFPCLYHLRIQDPVFAANIFKCCVTLSNISRQEEPINELPPTWCHPLQRATHKSFSIKVSTHWVS